MFTQTDGVYSYTFECEKKEDCLVCGKVRKVLEVDQKQKLSILIEKLKEGDFQMNQDCGRHCDFLNFRVPLSDQSKPTLQTVINGASKTLYLEKIEKTHENLSKSLGENHLIF